MKQGYDYLLDSASIATIKDLLFIDNSKISELFAGLSHSFPEYQEMDVDLHTGIYVASPMQGALQNTKGECINANWVTLDLDSYNIQIAAGQPPKADSMNLFWSTINDSEINNIIDLRNEHEYNNKDFNIQPYWPHCVGSTLRLEACSVYHEEESEFRFGNLSFIKHRYVLLSRSANFKKIIHRYEYREWRDLSVIPGLHLLSFCEFLDKMYANNNGLCNKLYLHCRGGVGRTGVLIMAYFLYKQIGDGRLKRENICHGILETLFQCRIQRGRLFVCNTAQLEALIVFARFLLLD